MSKGRGAGAQLRAGDVLAVTANDQKWLLCYCGRDASLGDIVWVRPKAMPRAVPLDCASFAEDGYYAFYPATAALRQRVLAREGFCAEGMRLPPPLRRIASPLSREGESPVWKIAADANVGTPYTLRTELTREEASIPEAAIWNHAYLLDKLLSGWHPASEGVDSGDTEQD